MMWKYLTKDLSKGFILSLNLINNLSDKKVLNILYAIANNPNKYYTSKYILKRDGSKRKLLVPSPTLKSIQRNILKNVLYSLSVSKYATGYIKNKTLKDNVKVHTNKKIVLKMDIKDFFTSVTFEDIYKVLPNNLFPPNIKVLITKLCTYDDYLPQGAPTSAYLSNLVMKNFDDYIGEYCKKRNISYTRYSDDLTFSGDFDAKKLKNKVTAFLESMGYNINNKKTKIIKYYKKQTVTGLTVNKKINLNKDYRNKIRQEMYYINKYGLDSHLNRIGKDKNTYLNNLLGRINYSLMINHNDKTEYYRKIIKNML